MDKKSLIMSLCLCPIAMMSYLIGLAANPSTGQSSDREEISQILNEYFYRKYEALKTNNPFDLSRIVDKSNPSTSQWLTLEQDAMDMHHLIYSQWNVRILEYDFDFEMTNFESKGNYAVVSLLENAMVRYSDNPDNPSFMYQNPHTINMVRNSAAWKILNDTYKDNMIELIKSTSKEKIKKSIQSNRANRRVYKEQVIRRERGANDSVTENWKIDVFTYDPKVAYEFADQYSNSVAPVPDAIKNISGWDNTWMSSYQFIDGSNGGDCTNFASQAIFQGTSYTTSDTNYFYPNASHNSDWWYYKFSAKDSLPFVPAGSLPWIRVGKLYDFLVGNYHSYYEDYDLNWVYSGPAGYSYDDLCAVKPGDLIFMKLNNDWAHTVMVDLVGSFTCTGINTYVVAHSANYYRRPLYEYSAYDWYPVRVTNYFKKTLIPPSVNRLTFLPIVTRSSIYAKSLDPYPSPLNFEVNSYSNNPYP